MQWLNNLINLQAVANNVAIATCWRTYKSLLLMGGIYCEYPKLRKLIKRLQSTYGNHGFNSFGSNFSWGVSQ